MFGGLTICMIVIYGGPALEWKKSRGSGVVRIKRQDCGQERKVAFYSALIRSKMALACLVSQKKSGLDTQGSQCECLDWKSQSKR